MLGIAQGAHASGRQWRKLGRDMAFQRNMSSLVAEAGGQVAPGSTRTINAMRAIRLGHVRAAAQRTESVEKVDGRSEPDAVVEKPGDACWGSTLVAGGARGMIRSAHVCKPQVTSDRHRGGVAGRGHRWGGA